MMPFIKYCTLIWSLGILLGVSHLQAQKLELGMAIVSSYGDTSDLSTKVAKVYDVRRNGIAPRGADWAELNPNIVISPSTWTLQNLGEIFGISIDSFGNVFMGASDVYKLDAQTGIHPGSFTGPAGTGGVYKANADNLKDIQTLIGTINSPNINELPTTILPNTGGVGNGIGNLTYDSYHHQLFLSNLEDGKIYRIDLNLPTPKIVSIYDPFEMDDGQSGMTPVRERIWGVGVFRDTATQQTKVYFARQYVYNVQSSAVFSIVLNDNGDFDAPFNSNNHSYHGNENLEIELNSATSNISRITDIAFSDAGNMLLAERGHAHKAGIYEYEKTLNNWNESHSDFNIGSWNLVIGLNGKNAAGGVDYGYRENGNNPYGFCDSLVWATANYMQTPSSGSSFYYGLEGIYSRGNLPVSHIPLYQSNAYTDLYIDFAGPSKPQSNLQVGDVEVFRVPCASFAGAPINEILACNNLLQVSLDTMGLVYLDIDLVTEGDGSNPCWQLFTYDDNGRLIDHNILTCDHVGTRIDFLVKDTCTQNSCWGQLDVEDKYAPQIACSSDTVRCRDNLSPYLLGFPIPNSAIVFPTADSSIFTVSNWDSCGDVQLHFSDEIFRDFDCDYDYKLILRHWSAQDEAGNISSCDDSIFVDLPNLLMDTIGLNDFFFSCDDTWPTTKDGNPDPSVTGWPISSECTTLFAKFEDAITTHCGASEKILRKWTLFDWCAKNGNPKELSFYQFIEITDYIAPNVYCRNNSSMVDTVGTDYYLCSGTYVLPIPQNLDKGQNVSDSSGIYVRGECSDWVYDVKYVPAATNNLCLPDLSSAISLGNPRNVNDAAFSMSDIPKGCNWFYYEITDACGNTSQCSIKIVVVDDLEPSVVCDAHTKVSLLGRGVARVNAFSFDDGTIDNCGLDSFAVRRMDEGQPCGFNNGQFESYIEFCCEDIGKTIMVEFMAVDVSGNAGFCMVEVEVEDKIKPRIVAPTDITIDCKFDFDINQLDLYFGKIVLDRLDVDEIFIKNDPHYSVNNNWLAGEDGYIQENCNHFTWTDSVIIDLHCGIGTIKRIFKVVDQAGLIDSDEQLIIIANVDPFDENDILWPDDILDNPIETDCSKGVTTDPTITGEPIANTNTKCIDFAIQYDDKYLFGGDSACYKIIRTWTVIDWCQFDRNTNPGWEHKQYIKVANHISPIFDNGFCDDKVFCDSSAYLKNAQCIGYATLVGTARDDCTDEIDLKWNYRLDIGSTGVWGQRVYEQDASGEYPIGHHKITWNVTDACGNMSSCVYNFEVRDCKPPTPVCRNGIVTVVMPSNGQIEVNVSHINLDSYDNCTNQSNLILSFTEDGMTQSILYNCDSLEGKEVIEKTVKLWVIDEKGNKDYCESIVRIQNNGACSSNLGGSIHGRLLTFDERGIDEVELILEKNNTIMQGPKYFDKTFLFDNLSLNENYSVTASSRINYGERVSTRDLVAIKKHLLGIDEFDEAWQFVAADANNSKGVSTRDIVELRKIILGKTEKLKKQDSWLFYNSDANLYSLDELYDDNNSVNIESLKSNSESYDFYGLKIGDVNGDLNGWFDRDKIQIRNDGLELIGEHFIQNKLHVIEIRTKDILELEGIQFTLELPNDYNLIEISSDKIDLDEGNYALFDEQLTFLWSGAKAETITPEEVLIKLVFESNINSKNMINMNSSITSAVVFCPDEREEELSLKMHYRDSVDQSVKDNFINISPNPFRDETTLQFYINESTDVNISIIDSRGKMMYENNGFKKSGMNKIKVQKSMISSGAGIYFIRIKTSKDMMTQKFIML